MSLINEALSKAGVRVSVRCEQEAGCGPTGYAMPVLDRTPSAAPVARAILLSAGVATLTAVLFVAVLFAWRRPDVARAHSVVEAAAPVPAVAGPGVEHTGLLSRVQAPKPPALIEPLDQNAARMPAVEPPSTVGPAVEPAVEKCAHAEVESDDPPRPRADPTAAGTEALREKTLVKSVEHPGVPALRLDGIVWTSHSPVALLNGTMVQPGDDIEGVVIKAIDPKRVHLELRGVRFYLRMP